MNNIDVIIIKDLPKDANDSIGIESLETIEVQVKDDSSKDTPEHDEQVPVQFEPQEIWRSTRKRVPPAWHKEYILECNIKEPSTFKEATCGQNTLIVMQKEFKVLHKNKTWKLVHGWKVIENKWIYKIKRDSNDQ